jgi:hypothetical protein
LAIREIKLVSVFAAYMQNNLAQLKPELVLHVKVHGKPNIP